MRGPIRTLFYLDRISLLDQARTLDRPVLEYFRHNVHVTPGGIASHRALAWAMEVLGPDRLMHATDYPFNSEHDFAARDFLTTASLTDDVRERIGHENWSALAGRIRR